MNNFNPHSRLASFYRYFYYTETLPNNLCNYFWGLVFAFILFPVVWPAMLLNLINKPIIKKTYTDYDSEGNKKLSYYYSTDYNQLHTALGLFFTFVIFVIGACVIGIIHKFGVDIKSVTLGITNIVLAIIYLYIVGVLTIFVSIGLFYLITFLMSLLPKKPEMPWEEQRKKLEEAYEKKCQKHKYKLENPSFLRLAWRWVVAFKEKNCPVIHWGYDVENKNDK